MTHIKETLHASLTAYAACISASSKARISCIVYDEQYERYLHGRTDEQRVFKKTLRLHMHFHEFLQGFVR